MCRKSNQVLHTGELFRIVPIIQNIFLHSGNNLNVLKSNSTKTEQF